MTSTCNFILGPCIDGTNAGTACGAPTESQRCPSHTFDSVDISIENAKASYDRRARYNW